MRNTALLGRTVLGCYLAVHGAQKLFGVFGGHGLEATAAGFAQLGLTPAKEMAGLAAAAELGGGLLTVTGLVDPIGPIVLAGTMTIASAVHRKSGPLASNGGYELPLTNLALATVLAASGPGALRLGRRAPKGITALVTVATAVLTAVALTKLLTARVVAPAPDETATIAAPLAAQAS
ncbi:MAG: DoxX family protein [Acidimicrobiia bacterium]